MTFGRNIQLLSVRFERRKVDEKSKPTRKLKHANSILEYFDISVKCHQNRSL